MNEHVYAIVSTSTTNHAYSGFAHAGCASVGADAAGSVSTDAVDATVTSS